MTQVPFLKRVSTITWRSQGTQLVAQAREAGDILLITGHDSPRVLVFPLRQYLPAVGPKRMDAMYHISREAKAIRANILGESGNGKAHVSTIGINEFRRDLVDALWKCQDSKASFVTFFDRPIALLIPVLWLPYATIEAIAAEIAGLLYG